MPNIKDSKQRFSSTIEYYHRYRPNYPEAVIQVMIDECGLDDSKIIADIGMGTGIFTRNLLDNHNTVFGVEPNLGMRNIAISILSDYPNFKPIDGSAEETRLPDHSVDFITCAQAFHWFDPIGTKQEFLRILKPQGWVIFLWNLRTYDVGLMQDYEYLLQTYGTDYNQVAADKNVHEKDIITPFFSPKKVNIKIFSHIQILDWDELKGRLLSTSYTPKEGEPRYEEMLDAAHTLFEKYKNPNTNKVDFVYETKVYFGQLSEKSKPPSV